MQTVNYTPVKVDVNIEETVLTSEGFYQVGFITENNTAPRTIVVETLEELASYGYNRGSMAYNFCLGVFSQNPITCPI